MELLHLLALLLSALLLSAASASSPFNCSDHHRLCTSFLSLRLSPLLPETPELLSMFDALPTDLTADDRLLFVRKNCSCSPSGYLANTTLTVRHPRAGGPAPLLVARAYGPLAVFPNATSRWARPGSVVALHLACGCSSGPWNYLVTYAVQPGDTLQELSGWFGVSMDSIESANAIDDPSNVTAGGLLYIPVNSVPGEPYPPKKADVSPSPAPSPEKSPLPVSISGIQEHHSSKSLYGWAIGSTSAILVLIAVFLLVCILFKSCTRGSRNLSKDPDEEISHKFHFLQRSTSGNIQCFKFGRCKPSVGDNHSTQISIPKGMTIDALDMDKPLVFSYEEVLTSTDGFSDSNLLGHGTYGSVYYGVLREQEVAIKRMTTTKSREFASELKVLCKVHHASLVELIGYSATGDELFVIYEYAQKGSLKNHLHDPQNKGHTSLSWISRVQIALDAARGLEYIHEHTKTHYVHRDIKTSNILLDGSFRAKVSDFGLAKLVSKTSDGEITSTKVVGTFGYLAPEYLRDGLATTRSDVYAFGVVLFEMISGKEAVTRTEGTSQTNAERRSLASVMLAALKNSPTSMSMASLKDCIDPSMMGLFPHDCVYKLAILAKQCVDEDPILRPDMKQVVITLSHILLSSIEWESALAGNSQVFSGLVQGR